MSYSIQQIAQFTAGKIRGNHRIPLLYLLIDSRKVVSPAESVFFALSGPRHDGHHYISDLYYRGVKVFVISRTDFNYTPYPEAVFIVVKNTLDALQQLAANHRKKFQYPVIGITGSNGKTIVKEWLAQVLGARYHVIRSPKSYNSQTGVPLSVWNMGVQHQVGIFEAGISQPGEMEKLAAVICPEIGIFTHLSDAHQENFSNLQQKVNEKLKLFSACKTIIYSLDDMLVSECIFRCWDLRECKKATWSEKKEATLQIIEKHIDENTTRFKGIFDGKTVLLEIPFSDEASIENAVTTWLALLIMGESPDFIAHHMKQLSGVAMRLEMKQGINQCTIINDSYNSDLGSLQIAIDFLMHQNQHSEKILILSDILQSGQPEHELYKAVAELIHRKQLHRLVGIGEALKNHAAFFHIPSEFYLTTDDFLASANRSQFQNQAILLKGARKFEFERISHILQQQAHRTVLEINLNALEHNLNYFRSLLHRETKICVMVKAFAYGSGTFEIANMLQFSRADYLAVAFADEGAQLRRSGITLPIVIMNPEPQGYDLMIENQLEPEIYSFTELDSFRQALKHNNMFGYPVHIKLDTGMHRSGFLPDEIEKLGDQLIAGDLFAVSSVFSHLAASDEPQHDDFTRLQAARFEAMYLKLIEKLNYKPFRHILNSAGIERFPEIQFEMVRLGIGLYGLSAIDQARLQQVGTLRSTIAQVKTVEPPETIGYGRRGKLKRTSVIATVPIGYADGLRRALGNGVGQMLVNGQRAPIIGSVCMDMTMIDITGIEAQEGDEVIIFGNGIPVTEMAEWLNTIPYEVLTGISPRVKRVYFKE